MGCVFCQRVRASFATFALRTPRLQRYWSACFAIMIQFDQMYQICTSTGTAVSLCYNSLVVKLAMTQYTNNFILFHTKKWHAILGVCCVCCFALLCGAVTAAGSSCSDGALRQGRRDSSFADRFCCL